MDKIFELQQLLIVLQDKFKDAILSEPDAEKHIGIIQTFSDEELKLFNLLDKEINSIPTGIVDNDLIEEQEDKENINNNNPLLNTFKKMLKEEASLEIIAKTFRELELIEIAKEFNVILSTKGTKIEKVKLIIELINR